MTTSQVTAVFRLGETAAAVLDLPRGSKIVFNNRSWCFLCLKLFDLLGSSSSRDESVKSIIGVKSEQVTHESVYAMPSKQDIGLEAVDESTKNPGMPSIHQRKFNESFVTCIQFKTKFH